jgi:hypothetical protein
MAFHVTDVAQEYAGLRLPDTRLERRAYDMISALAKRPTATFPKAFGSVAATEAAYRFLRNPRTVPAAVFQPHQDQAWARARDAATVLSIEDTSEMRFGGRAVRDGLGPLMNEGQGFFLHAALLVAFGEHPVPLGIGEYEILVRDRARRNARKRGVHWKRQYKDPNNERRRWERVSDAVGARAAHEQISVVHVGDREADDYAHLANCYGRGERFVFRMRFDRREACGDELTSQLLQRAPIMLEREVRVSTRTKNGPGRRRPKQPRVQRRSARLSVRAVEVLFRRPKHATDAEQYLQLNIVEAVELDPPQGEEPISWRLLTTDPIDTPEQVARIVDIYRARWLIEEYWKALKTGCAFEDRQLESLKTLETALAMFMPIAWQLLLIRAVSRATPRAPATAIVSARQFKLLQHLATRKNRWGLRLSADPRAEETARAIARLGGHLPQNGDPGWQVLRRGLDVLLDLEAALELLGAEEM